MKAPSKYTLYEAYRLAREANPAAQVNQRWVPARPEGYSSWVSRLKLAWMVFTGKGDVLIWPEGQ
jgi:hypothetical protein